MKGSFIPQRDRFGGEYKVAYMRKKNLKSISKRDKRLYRSFFGLVIAALMILALGYNSIFLMLHQKENLYFAEPRLFSLAVYYFWIFISFIFTLDTYNKTCGCYISIASLFKNQKSVLLRCLS